MAITELYNDTVSIGTVEWSLTGDDSSLGADTNAGIYLPCIEVDTLDSGDLFRFRTYEKVRSASTQRVLYEAFIGGLQTLPIWTCPALVLIHGWDMSLVKIAGSDRTLGWSIRRIA